ncbi:hypothetical protein [Salinispira pacifica]|uniref:Uncharacterized protein n=1 Tax=Salinispira pacifica TaxID=1307761 RepID=V5WFM3_9SPIO|nr:hypothetical protein [Salinispira pacifica]AHC14607.1 hypothetical protein L21SP2_1206 [Salinispira pacifica]
MSLKPIDLQNLFLRLNMISKQQAAQQEAPVHAQQVAAQEIEQKTRQMGEKVQPTEESSDGPEKIHDDQAKSRSKSHQSPEGEQGEQEEGSEKDDPFRDPDLGNRIDISG